MNSSPRAILSAWFRHTRLDFKPYPAQAWWVVILTLLLLLGQALPGIKFFSVPANYLPLHTALEFVAMAVSVMVFALAWNLRSQPDNSHLMLLGTGFLAVSLIDFAHTLSYDGMPVWITSSGPEKAINFWLVGRLVAAVVLLGVALRPVTHWSVAACHGAVLVAIALALGIWWVGLGYADVLPRTFVVGHGLTGFKVGSEYLLGLLYAAAAILLYRQGRRWNKGSLQWLAAAAWVQGLAEMFFTLYADVTDVFNLLGHVYKVMAYLMVYYAVFAAGVRAPYRKLRESHERLQGVLETALDGFLRSDDQGRLLETNPAYCQQSGYTHEELLGMRFTELEAVKNASDSEQHMKRIRAGGSDLFEARHRRKDGTIWQVEVSITYRRISGGQFFVFVRDITARKQAADALRHTNQLLKETEEIGKVGGWEFNMDSGVQTWTDEVYRIHEVDRPYTPVLDRSISFYTPASRQILEPALQRATEQGEPFDAELEIITAKGNPRIVHVIGKTDAENRRVYGFFQDVSERKQMEDQVRQLAFYDTLTQLGNRRLLFDRLIQTMAASQRSGCYAALMFLDLDNFKPLNDAHGHGVGDLLLLEVARRLTACVRETDTVSRFGGDEFVVLLGQLHVDQAQSMAQAGGVAEKIRASLSTSYLLKIMQVGQADATVEHHCSASIGVVVFFNHEVSRDEILQRADSAMYQAKEGGRNSIRFYAANDHPLQEPHLRH